VSWSWQHDFNYGILDAKEHRPWPMPSSPWVMTQTWHAAQGGLGIGDWGSGSGDWDRIGIRGSPAFARRQARASYGEAAT
jgi:hypothetical protein